MKSLSPLCWPCREQPLPWARSHGAGMRNPGAETDLILLAEPRCGSAALPAPSAVGRGRCHGCVCSVGAGDCDIWSVPDSTEPPWAHPHLRCSRNLVLQTRPAPREMQISQLHCPEGVAGSPRGTSQHGVCLDIPLKCPRWDLAGGCVPPNQPPPRFARAALQLLRRTFEKKRYGFRVRNN